MRNLSELEGAVLGVIWEKEPCTAYSIRSRFLASPSPRWSGSAGAIYPLLGRLERRRLVSSRAQKGSRRRGRLYGLTPVGLQLLRAWLAPPLAEIVVGVPPDPLRTRLSFLRALDCAGQEAFLAEALEAVRRHIRAAREDCRRTRDLEEDPIRHLVARGALSSLQARRRWLAEAARVLSGRRR